MSGAYVCEACAAELRSLADLNDHVYAQHNADAVFDLIPGVHRLVGQLEAVLASAGLGAAQQALACALWRRTMGHPSLAYTVDFEVDCIVLRHGGREIRAEVRMFPKGPVRDGDR